LVVEVAVRTRRQGLRLVARSSGLAGQSRAGGEEDNEDRQATCCLHGGHVSGNGTGIAIVPSPTRRRSPLPLPPALPKVGFWAVMHETRSDYAQILTSIFEERLLPGFLERADP
jgi:hypothetical protein